MESLERARKQRGHGPDLRFIHLRDRRDHSLRGDLLRGGDLPQEAEDKTVRALRGRATNELYDRPMCAGQTSRLGHESVVR